MASPAEADENSFTPKPLKPRPVLLSVLALVFAAWVAFLVSLYFKTEYPRRSTASRLDAKGVPPPDAPTQSAK
jgi:hypothetical protein